MLTLQEKVGQMLLVGFHGLQAPQYLLDWLAQGLIGGVLLFGRNIESPEQVLALTRSIHAAAKIPPLIGIDQEGGSVARLRTGFTESPGALALSTSHDPDLVRRMSQVLAEEMAALGINWNFAPDVDLFYTPRNPTVGIRSFGSDPQHVAQMAVAAVEGFHAGGVATCAKHFPGLGNTAIDTHEGLAVLDTTADELFERDMIPYQAVIKAGVASIMTTQTIFRSLDPIYPVSISPVVVNELLRRRSGFDGLVTTDCMEMHATSYSYAPAEAAVLAALAGMDTILFSHTYELQQAAINGLQEAAASGRLPLEVIDRANERIARFKARFVHPPQGLDHIRSAQHLEIAREAGRRGCVLLKSLRPLLPVTAERVALVEFASALESTATEKGDISGLASLLQQRFPRLKHVTLKVVDADPDHIIRAWELAESVDLLILATRNAHLYEFEESFARSLIELAPLTIVLCLRDPHDAEVLRADVMLATCGDAAPSLEAVVDILSGAYQPDGVLPITLEDLS